MKVLVTGGAGFIGSHTCLALLQKGYEVVAVDSFVNSKKKSLHAVIDIVRSCKKDNQFKFNIIEADIRDEYILDRLFLDSKLIGNPFQAVIHCAGLKSVNDSVLDPLLYWDVNLNGSIKLLRVMNKYDCRKIVFSSSATVYGLSNTKPINEKSDIKPINPYGQTKAAVEILLDDIYKSNPSFWKIANLRYFNPIGAHYSGLIGEAPIGIPNNIFPYITQVAAGKLEKLTVFGNDWPTKDGTGVRDYIHVMDLAEGHISALEYLIKNDNQIINLNLGTGIGTSVLELVETFEKVNNILIPLEFAKRRIGDCSTLIADNSLAISCLDWLPKLDLKAMCKDGWNWQYLNPEGYS